MPSASACTGGHAEARSSGHQASLPWQILSGYSTSQRVSGVIRAVPSDGSWNSMEDLNEKRNKTVRATSAGVPLVRMSSKSKKETDGPKCSSIAMQYRDWAIGESLPVPEVVMAVEASLQGGIARRWPGVPIYSVACRRRMAASASPGTLSTDPNHTPANKDPGVQCY